MANEARVSEETNRTLAHQDPRGTAMNHAIKLDLRRRDRSAVQQPAVWGVGNHARGEGELIDISSDGMFIALATSDARAVPTRGDEVNVIVHIGDNGYVVDGRVRWVGNHVATGRFGMGVSIDATSAYEAEAISCELTPAPSISGVFQRPNFDR